MDESFKKLIYYNAIETVRLRLEFGKITGIVEDIDEYIRVLQAALIEGRITRVLASTGSETRIYDDETKNKIAILAVKGQISIGAIIMCGKVL